jgi:RHS repeat-associated protein
MVAFAKHYDAAGNMISMPNPYDLDSALTCTYDAWNRLVKVTKMVGETEQTVAEYSYDGLNRRIVKLTYDEGDPSETRHFYLSSSNQVLEERVDTDPFANVQNVWGLRYVDDLVLRDRDTSETRDGVDERHYALQDANWNVVAIAAPDGEVVERYTYTAYGKCEVRMDDFGLKTGGTGYDWRSLYTTREFDPETGFYYYRARYYDADMGRFIGRDPIGIAGGVNLYQYAGGSPATRNDPSGLFSRTTKYRVQAQGLVKSILGQAAKSYELQPLQMLASSPPKTPDGEHRGQTFNINFVWRPVALHYRDLRRRRESHAVAGLLRLGHQRLLRHRLPIRLARSAHQRAQSCPRGDAL